MQPKQLQIVGGRTRSATADPDRVRYVEVSLASVAGGPDKATTGNKTMPDRVVAKQTAS